MRVVATSDFHGKLPPDVPPCDLLIVAGDCLGSGYYTMSHDTSLYGWLERQPAETIVGIAGNHDYLAVETPDVARDLPWIYLQDNGCVVDGLNVWGSPWATRFFDWPFMASEDELAERWALIPDDTEILVVHGPAYGLNDRAHGGEHVGSISLRDRLRDLTRLQLLVTGHIHEAYGQTVVFLPGPDGQMRQVPCVNASLLDFNYQRFNPPIAVDLFTNYAIRTTLQTERNS